MKRLPLHGLDPELHADGDVATLVGGKATWAPPAAGTALIPLIAVVGGSPSFVFDDDNQLVMTEVPR
jgi:hypothetical protein